MTTGEREALMAKLREVAATVARLEKEPPTGLEEEISRRYPNMPRERVIRLVAEKLVG